MVGLSVAKITPVFSYIWEVGRMGGYQPEGDSEDEPGKQQANALPLSGDHESFKKRLVFNPQRLWRKR
jgi:hypothetical protein